MENQILNKFFVLVLLSCFTSQNLFADQPKGSIKTLDIGLVLRLKDRFNDTISGIKLGIETAKILFEKEHPEIRVRFHSYSHGDKIQEVISAAQHAARDHLSAVIGGELTEESFVLRDQFEGKKIVWITPTSSNPEVTYGHRFAFRTCFSDQKVASDIAQFTSKHLKPRAIGMIHNISSPYADYQNKRFLEIFKQNLRKGNEVPIYEEIVLGDTLDYETQIKLFKEKKVSHVVIFTHPSDLLRFVLQARGLSFYPTYVGSDGWGDNQYVYRNLIQGGDSNTPFIGYRNSYWHEEAKSPWSEQFREQYRKLHGSVPTAWGATGFDTAWILFTAMSRAADPKNAEQVRVELEKIQNLPLVTHPHFSFDRDHSPQADPGVFVPLYRIDRSGIHEEARHL